MITIKDNEVTTDKWMRRKGSTMNSWYKKCTLLPGETADSFEEVEEKPEEEIPEELKMIENNV